MGRQKSWQEGRNGSEIETHNRWAATMAIGPFSLKSAVDRYRSGKRTEASSIEGARTPPVRVHSQLIEQRRRVAPRRFVRQLRKIMPRSSAGIAGISTPGLPFDFLASSTFVFAGTVKPFASRDCIVTPHRGQCWLDQSPEASINC
jgi:hypothetical protein